MLLVVYIWVPRPHPTASRVRSVATWVAGIQAALLVDAVESLRY
jgi:hypothetical protein